MKGASRLAAMAALLFANEEANSSWMMPTAPLFRVPVGTGPCPHAHYLRKRRVQRNKRLRRGEAS